MTDSTCTATPGAGLHVRLAEADPLTVARRMMRYYSEEKQNAPMSDICKHFYWMWMRDHVDTDPKIAAFVELHGLQTA